MKVGVRDISRKTGFSPATVSNALNHKRGVSKETAEAILRVAQELGYQRPSRLDRIQFVVVRKSGKVLDESDFHPAVVDGVEREAKLHGLTTSYVTIDLADPGAHSQLRELCQDTTSGIVLLGTEMMEEDYEPFYGSAAPLVIVDGWCYHSFIESIVISNESSSYRAVRYLISHGHERIGYLKGDGSMDTAIVIRSAFVRNGTAIVQAGAGVVRDSQPQSEANETLHKAYAVLTAIASAQGKKVEVLR